MSISKEPTWWNVYFDVRPVNASRQHHVNILVNNPVNTSDQLSWTRNLTAFIVTNIDERVPSLVTSRFENTNNNHISSSWVLITHFHSNQYWSICIKFDHYFPSLLVIRSKMVKNGVIASYFAPNACAQFRRCQDHRKDPYSTSRSILINIGQCWPVLLSTSTGIPINIMGNVHHYFPIYNFCTKTRNRGQYWSHFDHHHQKFSRQYWSQYPNPRQQPWVSMGISISIDGTCHH